MFGGQLREKGRVIFQLLFLLNITFSHPCCKYSRSQLQENETVRFPTWSIACDSSVYQHHAQYFGTDDEVTDSAPRGYFHNDCTERAEKQVCRLIIEPTLKQHSILMDAIQRWPVALCISLRAGPAKPQL